MATFTVQTLHWNAGSFWASIFSMLGSNFIDCAKQTDCIITLDDSFVGYSIAEAGFVGSAACQKIGGYDRAAALAGRHLSFDCFTLPGVGLRAALLSDSWGADFFGRT